MKVGIIGSGMIAAVHGPVILKQPNVTLVGIADQDLSRARAVSANLKAGNVYQDAAEMIEHEQLDVVHILTPPSTHPEIAIMAMQKGCHVLVEKPMALTLKDARAMVDAAIQYKVKLCVNHNMIYEVTTAKAIELARSGRIGSIVSVEAYFSYNAMRNPSVLEDGAELCHWAYKLNGGPLQDQMPHMASMLFEFLPKVKDVRFMQFHRGVLPNPWPDELRLFVDGDGLIGQVTISFSERPDVILLTLHGTLGMIQANLFNDVMTVSRQSKLPRAASRGMSGFQTGFQNIQSAISNVWKFVAGKMDKSNGIEGLVKRFYQAILTGGEVPIAVDKALRTVELIERIWPEPVVQQTKAPSPRYKTEVQMPLALVTGASGFLGSHLLKKLAAENVRARVIMRPNSIHAGRLKQYDVEVISADLADQAAIEKAMDGIKVVYHLGSAMNNNWHDHEETTIKGTTYLSESAIAHKVDRFLFVSTLAVYDLINLRNNTSVSEDTPYQKNSKQMGPYTHYKIEAEKMLLQRQKENGLPVTIVRPGIIIGPSGPVFPPHLGLKNGDTLFIVIGKGNNVLPLTYVENTVDGLYLAATSTKAVGQIYNLIDEGHITINDYLKTFVHETGIPAKIVHVPYFLPYCAFGGYEIAASLGLLKKGVTSRRQLRWKTKPVIFNSSKARNDLGWKTTVSIEDGLKRTFDWYVGKFGNER